MNLSASDTIAAASMVVALCALVATVWQASAARRHNRLAVRPHLDFAVRAFPLEAVELVIRNEGLGPAVVTSVAMTFHGTRYALESWASLPSEVHQRIQDLSLGAKWNLFGPGTLLPAGRDVTVIGFPQTAQDMGLHNRAVILLRELEFDLSYESMYGEARRLVVSIPPDPLPPVEFRESSNEHVATRMNIRKGSDVDD